MEVLLESEEQMDRNKEKGRGKRQRPNGPPAPTPAAIANQTGRLLTEREAEWLDRLVVDPASFAAVEREVHDQARGCRGGERARVSGTATSEGRRPPARGKR